MGHFGDKELWCEGCKKHIKIKFNQVGGFWHLNGWTNKNGVKFWGGYCTPCFDKLQKVKKDD